MNYKQETNTCTKQPREAFFQKRMASKLVKQKINSKQLKKEIYKTPTLKDTCNNQIIKIFYFLTKGPHPPRYLTPYETKGSGLWEKTKRYKYRYFFLEVSTIFFPLFFL